MESQEAFERRINGHKFTEDNPTIVETLDAETRTHSEILLKEALGACESGNPLKALKGRASVMEVGLPIEETSKVFESIEKVASSMLYTIGIPEHNIYHKNA